MKITVNQIVRFFIVLLAFGLGVLVIAEPTLFAVIAGTLLVLGLAVLAAFFSDNDSVNQIISHNYKV